MPGKGAQTGIYPYRVAVGTALAGGPPHRSQRAGLPHWAPASDTSVEAHRWVGIHDAGGWEPSASEAIDPCPVHAGPLAATPKRPMPVPLDLGAEGPHGVDVAGHRVVGEGTPHH